MKSKEEIKTEIYLGIKESIGGNYGFFSEGFDLGYTQCQEDMADKKYTEEDIRKAFEKGWESREPQHDGGWKTTLTAQNYIKSLNKQNNENIY